jgi:hypothetical protein
MGKKTTGSGLAVRLAHAGASCHLSLIFKSISFKAVLSYASRSITAFDAKSRGSLIQLYAGLCCDNLNEKLLAEAKTPRLSASHNLPYDAALRRQGRCVDVQEHGILPKPASEAVSGLFRIPTEALENLKATVSASLLHGGTTTWISTLDAIAVLIWSCITHARAPLMDVKTTCTLNVAVNARSQLHPLLPDDYLGNCIIGSIVQKPLSAFVNSTCLSNLAASIRASYSQIDDHLIRAQFIMISAEPDISLLFSGPPDPASYLLITSWAAIPLYVGFGRDLGIPEHVSVPTGPGQYGICVLQLGKLDMARSLDRVVRGDLELYLGLEREAMQ